MTKITTMLKIKKLLSILFSISALLIMTAYAGENRSANDNSFAGFDVYTFSAGDKDATYYLNENTLHIQERSLGSRYNSYDQTITFSTIEKNGVPYIRYTESDRQYVSSDSKKFEVKKNDGMEREAVFFKNEYFFVLLNKDGTCLYGAKNAYDTWEYHVHDTEVKQSSFLKEKTKSYSINDMGCNFPEKRTVWGAPWCEGVQGQGIGERLEFSLKKNNSYAEVFSKQKIFISIGYVDYSRPDLYNANSRPKILSVYINNTFYKDVRLEDTSEYQDLLKDRILAASDTIKLVIKDVYPGEKYQDTCINDIFILPLR